jgi:hypothetical protein
MWKKSHTFETYHNRKRKVPIVIIATVKSTKLKHEIMHNMLNLLGYPYNMLVLFVPMPIINLEIILKRLKYKTCLEPKFVNSSTVALKPLRFDKVLVNVIVVVTICSHNQSNTC